MSEKQQQGVANSEESELNRFIIAMQYQLNYMEENVIALDKINGRMKSRICDACDEPQSQKHPEPYCIIDKLGILLSKIESLNNSNFITITDLNRII